MAWYRNGMYLHEYRLVIHLSSSSVDICYPLTTENTRRFEWPCSSFQATQMNVLWGLYLAKCGARKEHQTHVPQLNGIKPWMQLEPKMRLELTTYALRVERRSRIELKFRNYRFRFPKSRAPVASPTMTMTKPIGKVRNISQGVEPRAVLSLKALSTKIEATRLKRRGEIPKIIPPSTSGDLRFFCCDGGGGGGGGGKLGNAFSSDM